MTGKAAYYAAIKKQQTVKLTSKIPARQKLSVFLPKQTGTFKRKRGEKRNMQFLRNHRPAAGR